VPCILSIPFSNKIAHSPTCTTLHNYGNVASMSDHAEPTLLLLFIPSFLFRSNPCRVCCPFLFHFLNKIALNLFQAIHSPTCTTLPNYGNVASMSDHAEPTLLLLFIPSFLFRSSPCRVCCPFLFCFLNKIALTSFKLYTAHLYHFTQLWQCCQHVRSWWTNSQFNTLAIYPFFFLYCGICLNQILIIHLLSLFV
jgi:hypothetical protein